MRKSKLCLRLKAARAREHLSIRDVQKKSKNKITHGYYSELETGVKADPHPRVLRILSQALKMDYVELLIFAGHLTAEDLRSSRFYYR